jgi:hypothetical protein
VRRGHPGAPTNTNGAHDGVTDQHQRRLADDAVDGHEDRPRQHAKIQGDRHVECGGKKHQACPDKAENGGDVGHDLDGNRRQIAVHPPRLQHDHADDDVDHARLGHDKTRIPGDQCGRARAKYQEQAHPLHGIDRLAARKLPADLDHAQRHAEDHG